MYETANAFLMCILSHTHRHAHDTTIRIVEKIFMLNKWLPSERDLFIYIYYLFTFWIDWIINIFDLIFQTI